MDIKYINKVLLSVFVFIATTFISCDIADNSDTVSKAKQDILTIEKEFETCVRREGITAAFTKFAADNAVLNRKNKLIKGKKAIKDFYEKQKADKDQLIWNAEFVDVSASADIAYTYGSYIFTAIDSTGISKEYIGIFHTVWKKQSDGTWKYVWD